MLFEILFIIQESLDNIIQEMLISIDILCKLVYNNFSCKK